MATLLLVQYLHDCKGTCQQNFREPFHLSYYSQELPLGCHFVLSLVNFAPPMRGEVLVLIVCVCLSVCVSVTVLVGAAGT